ncbi:MAG: chalcone isomerase family protein [Chthoniobacterales bacterium]
MKKRTSNLVIALCFVVPLISVSGPLSYAAEISGIKLPDQVSLEGKTLKLNGAGLRQATILKVNVYAGGLYLETASQDADAIAKSDQLKAIEMVFMRDVSAKQIADALNGDVDKNCEADCSKLKAQLGTLAGALKDMKQGEKMTYHFLADRVDVFAGGAKLGALQGKEASRQMIRCWIGKNPPNTGLKEGLLGIRK